MWKRLLLPWLLFFSLTAGGFSQSLALAEEEKAKLPELSKETLIQIILTYDQSWIEIENSWNERENDFILRENSLNERESELNQRETTLTENESDYSEKEAHLNLRENLLATSYELMGESKKEAFWKGFHYGSIIGGGVGGYLGFMINRQ